MDCLGEARFPQDLTYPGLMPHTSCMHSTAGSAKCHDRVLPKPEGREFDRSLFMTYQQVGYGVFGLHNTDFGEDELSI